MRGRRPSSPSSIRAAAAGAGVGSVLGLAVPIAWWRPGAVGAAAGLVLLAGIRLASLARSEWRREAPPRRRYAEVVLLLTGAVPLLAVATI